MKKSIFLLTSCGLLAGSALAQISAPVQQNEMVEQTNQYIQNSEELIGSLEVSDVIKPFNMTTGANDAQVGKSKYDLQSNSSMASRIVLFDDGTASAIWTMGNNASAFDDRGTGYTYYNGSAWTDAPAARIESYRTGWPCIAQLGADGEVIITHGHSTGNLTMLTREHKGTGDWNESFITAPTGAKILWPHVMTSGDDHNTIHVLALTNPSTPYQELKGAVVYYRSKDGGANWDINGIVIPGMTKEDFVGFSSDEYVWSAPQGNTIAFSYASKWKDLFIMKSEDNGDTWTKTTIWKHPVPKFDFVEGQPLLDTIFCPGANSTIALDKDGKAHVAFDISRVRVEDPKSEKYSSWRGPGVDGIVYWEEGDAGWLDGDLYHCLSPNKLDEEDARIGFTPDVDGDGKLTFVNNLDGVTTWRAHSMSSHPQLIATDNGKLVLVYASITEGFNNGEKDLNRLWIRVSNDNGATWEDLHDLLEGDFVHTYDDCYFPSMAKNNNGSVYVIYQTDENPGTAVDEDHTFTDNNIYVLNDAINKYVGVEDLAIAKTVASLSNYPNPANGLTTIACTLNSNSDVTVEVFNMMGEKVYSIIKNNQAKGAVQVPVNTSAWAKGIYTYRVKAGNTASSNKMIVE